MYKKWLTLVASAVFFVNVAIASSDYGPIVRGDTLWGIAKIIAQVPVLPFPR